MCLEFLCRPCVPDEVAQDECGALAHDDWRISVFSGEVCAGPFSLFAWAASPPSNPGGGMDDRARRLAHLRVPGGVCPGPCDAFQCPDCHGHPGDGIWDKSVPPMGTDGEERLIATSAYRARARECERANGGRGLHICDESPSMCFERPARQRPRSSTPPNPPAKTDLLGSLSDEPRRKRERTEHQTENPNSRCLAM